MGSSVQSFTAPLRFCRKIPSQYIVRIFVPSKSKRKRTYPVFSFKDSSSVIRALEKEIRFGYWPHVDFSWTDTACAAGLPVWKGKNAQSS